MRGAEKERATIVAIQCTAFFFIFSVLFIVSLFGIFLGSAEAATPVKVARCFPNGGGEMGDGSMDIQLSPEMIMAVLLRSATDFADGWKWMD